MAGPASIQLALALAATAIAPATTVATTVAVGGAVVGAAAGLLVGVGKATTNTQQHENQANKQNERKNEKDDEKKTDNKGNATAANTSTNAKPSQASTTTAPSATSSTVQTSQSHSSMANRSKSNVLVDAITKAKTTAVQVVTSIATPKVVEVPLAEKRKSYERLQTMLNDAKSLQQYHKDRHCIAKVKEILKELSKAVLVEDNRRSLRSEIFYMLYDMMYDQLIEQTFTEKEITEFIRERTDAPSDKYLTFDRNVDHIKITPIFRDR